MGRRTFLRQMLGVSASPLVACVDRLVSKVEHLPAGEVAQDEAFWAAIRAQYKLKPDYINLENGYYCMMPEQTLERYIRRVREMNLQASWYMRTVQWDDKRAIATQLASLGGCSPDELIITRNTTESLDLVIGGFHWKAGDEAVMAAQDYKSMLAMFELQARRHGIVNRIISIPNHPKNDAELVDLYASMINDKTRLLMVCHVVNVTGQILPVRKIADMAHERGVEVMVDGAHGFAHVDAAIPDLGGDYYGASLHKWLSAPLGAGILWVKKDKIGRLWPLIAEPDETFDGIRGLNHTGTHPAHTDLAIADAIAFHMRLGPERKEARLRHLQTYWTRRVRSLPKIVLNTPVEPARACAIANVGVEGIKPGQLAKTLLDKYRIWTVAIDGAGVHGCRITPNVYTSTGELDTLVDALTELAA